MKKLLCILLICLTMISLVGCGAERPIVTVNVENDSSLNGQVFGVDALVEIGNYLYYDSATRIVYWWNGSLSAANYTTTPSPYYAPNGLPYLYNPETNTFEEIER